MLHDTDSCYTVIVNRSIDTVYYEGFQQSKLVELDSLQSDIYKITIFNNKAQSEPIITKYISLLPNVSKTINIDLSIEETIEKFDTVSRYTIRKQKNEGQLSIGYFNNDWVNKISPIKNNFSLGLTVYYWSAFSKHFGILGGYGLGISQHYFVKDTMFANSPQFQKKFERYTNFKLNCEIKFRISSGNQQLDGTLTSKVIIDIGAGYYLPIAFRKVINYSENTKVINKYIHQFTDFRAFINFGFVPITFFCEYRLSDFLIGNYPELPKYDVGIRLLIGH